MSFTTCYNQTVYPNSFCEVTDQEQCRSMNEAVRVTPKFTAMFSMIGVTLIIYRFATMKPKNRKTYDRLMLGMSLMNFWGSLGFFIGTWTFSSIPPGETSSAFCNWQGWLLQINSAVFWYNGVLATNFVMRIKLGWSEDKVRRLEPYMHVVAWFYPVVTSFIALGLNMYGRAGPWCWITVHYDWARWAFFFAFLWAIMLYTAICMIIIVVTVKKSDDETAHIRDSHTSGNSSGGTKKKRMGKKTRQVAIQAILYVGTFLMTWVFGTANRIQNAVVANTPGATYCTIFALVWLHSLFVPAQGFFNFLVYIYPRVVDARHKREQREKQMGVDHEKKEGFSCKRLLLDVTGKLQQGFVIVFGCERLEKSDSQGDSQTGRGRGKQAPAAPPSHGPSGVGGDVPSDHPKTQDYVEEEEGDDDTELANGELPPKQVTFSDAIETSMPDVNGVKSPAMQEQSMPGEEPSATQAGAALTLT